MRLKKQKEGFFHRMTVMIVYKNKKLKVDSNILVGSKLYQFSFLFLLQITLIQQ